MQVKKTNSTKNRTSSEIDLFSDARYEVPSELKEEIASDVGEYLKEQILKAVAESTSPISGGAFKKSLSPAFKKKKESEGLPGVANLEYSGQMLDSLDYKVTSKGIELGVFGEPARRADGHNNFSGESKLPKRQFLPEEGQAFKGSIQQEIDKIIRDKLADNITATRRDFATIRNKQELFETLKEMFPDFNRAQIVDTVTRSPKIAGLLNEFNLLRFLADEG